ncbi:hypothetical protein [Staphylococcus sp. NAM3COL9]|uniref:hypothetical protein n=1 Tax=Staphylococcus sp. NAM3COL9 TaxID=1667172 RepID=UPI00070F69CA|nr:hypothetical protein [Staphylococcus sp. NAM3COL9]KRG11287.1 hypothetical protein ACA31_01075 [Staphylococcus sp. NAM3COL9]
MQRPKLRKTLFTLHFLIVISFIVIIVVSGYPISQNLWMMIPIWLGIIFMPSIIDKIAPKQN